MFTALLTASGPVRTRFSWISKVWKKRRTGAVVFTLPVPERWSDLPDRQRLTWWRVVCALKQNAAARVLLQKMVRPLPTRVRRMIAPEDQVALLRALRWACLRPDCSDIALSEITLRGTRYVLAKPMGRNVTAGEFAVCDDLYKQVIDKNDLDALRTLTAILFRERDADREAARARGDERTPYRNKDEATARIKRMGEPPVEMQLQALYYFAGLKQVIHRLYGRHIFQNENTESTAPAGPDFGWWGVLQGVAESGVFGDLRSTYQSFLHEVCVFLVRKKQESDAVKAAHENARNNTTKHTDE